MWGCLKELLSPPTLTPTKRLEEWGPARLSASRSCVCPPTWNQLQRLGAVGFGGRDSTPNTKEIYINYVLTFFCKLLKVKIYIANIFSTHTAIHFTCTVFQSKLQNYKLYSNGNAEIYTETYLINHFKIFTYIRSLSTFI